MLAADENLAITARTADFISPKGTMSRTFRDGVLALAEREPFARRLVNSGRLSVATCYAHSSLNGPDQLAGECPAVRPGAAALDAPLGNGWLLDHLDGWFQVILFNRDGSMPDAFRGVQADLANRHRLAKFAIVSRETACARYGAERDPALYLFRPDQHVAARWRSHQPGAIQAAVDWAVCKF
jgi:3-(3-hydroxy-phenyl)propionate hydroxylase